MTGSKIDFEWIKQNPLIIHFPFHFLHFNSFALASADLLDPMCLRGEGTGSCMSPCYWTDPLVHIYVHPIQTANLVQYGVTEACVCYGASMAALPDMCLTFRARQYCYKIVQLDWKIPFVNEEFIIITTIGLALTYLQTFELYFENDVWKNHLPHPSLGDKMTTQLRKINHFIIDPFCTT